MTAVARIHAFEPRSRANGPGARFVVWFQGCTLGCPGCFNPTTHDAAGGGAIALDELLRELTRAAASGIEGISLSGGEPLQQPQAARALLDAARALGLTTLAFSGYTIDEIRELPGGPDVLARRDVLIDGRYIARERLATGLRGSANQRIQLLTDRYARRDVESTPVAEIRIAPTGDIVLTGVDPLPLKLRLKQRP
jgi:anaerobic ribonucleoside-triphosphate reductase activating protein